MQIGIVGTWLVCSRLLRVNNSSLAWLIVKVGTIIDFFWVIAEATVLVRLPDGLDTRIWLLQADLIMTVLVVGGGGGGCSNGRPV